ncbi:MAG TPA: type II secretion system F family protein [Terriglobales bacterium]|jgi:tight adherence protein B|nr:type II secretion system F family protein [Terriglobales bacterium]
MPFVIAILIFVAVTVAVFAITSLFDQRKEQARVLRDRLSTVQKPAEQALPDVALLRDEVLSRIPAFDTFLRRSERVSALQKMLAQGHVDVRAGNFLILCAAAALVFAVLGVFASGNFMIGWAGALLGFFVPYAYAAHRRTKRFQQFEEKFPEAIDTLARAVRAGHAFTTALEMIANEVSEPVAGEFRQLYEEQKFGLPVRDALVNLADRVPLVDVKFFVTAVMLQRETGGNLAEILDNLSYVIRERFKILRQVRVHTAQGRLTMVLLMALPPAIVVIMMLINPGFIRPLFTEWLGHVGIVVGITLQTLGYFFIRKIIRIQV